MAAAALDAPGTEYGPCDTKCGHIDCDDIRTMAETICSGGCEQPIGYAQPFFQTDNWGKLTHASCMYS